MRHAIQVAVLCALVLWTTAPATAVIWDNGEAADQNWSSAANWSTDTVPTSSDTVEFNDSTDGGASGVVTNVVDTDFQVATLRYTLQSGAEVSFYQTTEIAAGATLLVTGSLEIAPNDYDMGGARTVDVTITGGSGSVFQVGATGTHTADIIIARNPDDPSGRLLTGNLDMSGLETFIAYVDEFNLANTARDATGTVTLATNNLISANTITLSRATGSNTSTAAVLELGQTNVLNADTINVAERKSRAEVYFQSGLAADPTVTIRGTDGGSTRADVNVGYQSDGGSGTVVYGTLDLTGGIVDALIDNLSIGERASGSGAGDATGTFKMSAGTLDANTIEIGQSNTSTNSGGTATATFELQGGTVTAGSVVIAGQSGTGPATGTLTMTGGSFSVSGDAVDGGGTSTLDIQSGTFVAGLRLTIDTLNVGASGQLGRGIVGLVSGAATADTATFASGAELSIDESGLISTYSVDMADQTTWTAGTGTWGDVPTEDWSDGLPAGFTVNDGDSFDFLQATTFSDGGASLATAGWSLSSTATGFTVTRTGGTISSGPVRAVIDDSTADVARLTNLHIAEQAGVDATRLDMIDGTLTIGTTGDPKDLTLSGTSGQGVIQQDGGTILVNGNVLDGGGDSIINVDGGTMTVTGDLSVDSLTVAADGGTATIEASGAVRIGNGSGTDLGLADTTTAANADAVADFSTASSVTINVDNLLMGTQTDNSGNTSRGELRLSSTGANSVTAGTILMGDSPGATNAGVTSQMVLGGSTNDFQVDQFTIAGLKSVAEVTILDGGSFSLTGTSGTGTGILDLSRRTTDTGVNTLGTLDLSNAASVTIDVAQIRLGTITTGNGTGDSRGVLILSNTANTVTADSILVGDSPAAGNTDVDSQIVFGSGENDVNVDTFTVGGQKSNALVTIGAGGTLTLGGKSSDAADLRIGYNSNSGTGTNTSATMDLSGGTFDATLDEVVIGYHAGGGTGSGSGALTMDAGTVTANSILLAEPSTSSNAANSVGTLNFAGGTLTVGTISEGGGTAAFNFTGGTLSVVNFNLAAGLVQDGGVLSPGNSPGTTNIAGDYLMNDGSLLIEIEGVGTAGTDYDVVNVGGDFDAGGGTLELLVSGLTGADLGATFEIINLLDDGATTTAPFVDIPLVGGRVEAATGYIFAVDYYAGTGNDIVLTLLAVPEPSTFAALMGLAGMLLLGYLRRRRRS